MHFEAIFRPLNSAEYTAEAERLIGKKVAVQNGWLIEEGPHRGQQCYYIPNSTLGLIPQSDLAEIKSVPFVQWRSLHNRIVSGN